MVILHLTGAPVCLMLLGISDLTPSRLCLSALYTQSLFLLSLVISVSVYRLSPFHPLATYPGPVLFKLTRLAALWVCVGGKQHLYYHELHKKYGPYMRTGAFLLVIESAIEDSATHSVFMNQGQTTYTSPTVLLYLPSSPRGTSSKEAVRHFPSCIELTSIPV